MAELNDDYQWVHSVLKDKRLYLTNLENLVLNTLQEDFEIQELKPILIKSRIKDSASLIDKIKRKSDENYRNITQDNLCCEIEDLVGTRLVLAEKRHVEKATREIHRLDKEGIWKLNEEIHYVWHPEEAKEVAKEGKYVAETAHNYCSRHFILTKPGIDSDSEELVKCELQIRTVIEEAIFENLHRVIYKKRHCESAIRIMNRLVELLESADRLLVDAYELSEMK